MRVDARRVRRAAGGIPGSLPVDRLDEPLPLRVSGAFQRQVPLHPRPGRALSGADLCMESDVPAGAGLSSSAALTISVGLSLLSLAGETRIDRRMLALAGQAAEHRYVGTRCGLVDQLDRILPAMKIARRSRLIALESVYAGLGLSVAGMIAASLGIITPVQGAIFQEVIDVAVILNALRALRGPSI